MVNVQSRQRRVWCETLPYTRVVHPSLLARLEEYGVGIILAVRPENLAELDRTVRAIRGAGVALDFWPMLENDVGRWAHAGNARAFRAFAGDVARRVQAIGPERFRVAIDLEPSWTEVDAWLSARSRGKALARAAQRVFTRSPGIDALIALATEPIAPGVDSMPTVLPVFAGPDPWGGPIARALGTVAPVQVGRSVNVMAYTSIVHGWSKGHLSREDAMVLLDAIARRLSARLGDAGSVSLGVVGPGALGDEPTYADPDELAEDAAICEAAGVWDLVLFDLGGVVARGNVEAWLYALTHPPARPALSPRLGMRALLAGGRSFERACHWVGALSPRARATRSS